MPRLTRRDLGYLKQAISGETLNYLGHKIVDRRGLKPSEEEHLHYLLGLNDRLDAELGVIKPERVTQNT